MPTWAVPAVVYRNPTQIDGVTGDELPGVDQDRLVRFDYDAGIRTFRQDFDPDDVVQLAENLRTPKLRIPLVEHSAIARLLYMSPVTADGAVIGSDEGQRVFDFITRFTLVVRPIDTAETLFLYSQGWQLTKESIKSLRFSAKEVVFDAAELVLQPSRPVAGSALPAWMLDSAANINTTFGLP